MGTFTISSTGKPASGTHTLAGGKHSFAHSLACAAIGDSGIIRDVPNIVDTEALIESLGFIFNKVKFDPADHVLHFGAPKYQESITLKKELLEKSRNLYCLIPAFLNRSRYVTLEGNPKGCSIGTRPTDWYLSTMEKFGVVVNEDGDHANLTLTWPKKTPATIDYEYPTMTGTIIAVATAAITPGFSRINGATVEPSCDDQIECLKSMGGTVKREGTDIVVNGDQQLSPANYNLTADRVHAVTIITAALLTKGEVTVESDSPIRIPEFVEFLRKIGAHVFDKESSISVRFPSETNFLKATSVDAGSEPLFSSDWVPFAALLMAARSKGSTTITDNVFLKRFQFIECLSQSGLENITSELVTLNGRKAVVARISGKPDLTLPGGHPPLCQDIRGSAAIVLSSLISSAPLTLDDDFQLRRGYEDLCEDLRRLDVVKIIRRTK